MLETSDVKCFRSAADWLGFWLCFRLCSVCLGLLLYWKVNLSLKRRAWDIFFHGCSILALSIFPFLLLQKKNIWTDTERSFYGRWWSGQIHLLCTLGLCKLQTGLLLLFLPSSCSRAIARIVEYMNNNCSSRVKMVCQFMWRVVFWLVCIHPILSFAWLDVVDGLNSPLSDIQSLFIPDLSQQYLWKGLKTNKITPVNWVWPLNAEVCTV